MNTCVKRIDTQVLIFAVLPVSFKIGSVVAVKCVAEN